MIPKDKIDELKKILEEDKARIEDKLKTLKDMEIGDSPGRDNEDADETEELANKQGMIDSLEERVERIETALKKIEKGAYGTCEKCGKEIGEDLLSVDAESKLCKECKAL